MAPEFCVLVKSSPVTFATTGPGTVRVGGLIVCPPSVGVSTIDVVFVGTPEIV